MNNKKDYTTTNTISAVIALIIAIALIIWTCLTIKDVQESTGFGILIVAIGAFGISYNAAFWIVDKLQNIKLKYAKREPKTKSGKFLCWVGLHRWKYHHYRTCRRCGRFQTLYEYSHLPAPHNLRWED